MLAIHSDGALQKSILKVRGVFVVAVLIGAFFSCNAFAQHAYKYKDQSGRWVFSDKRPEKAEEVEKLKYNEDIKESPKPRIFTRKQGDWYYMIVDNPYHAPIEIVVYSSIFKSGAHNYIVSSATEIVLHKSRTKIPAYKYKWQLGDPEARQVEYLYRIPVSSGKVHKITQSYNGKFSHFQRPNIYAVDIQMSVGDYIGAARGGTVIWTKDDYHMGGGGKYFLDKANYIKVLHDDGTYAVYAHILMGSAVVQPGDKVKAGDILARAGSSGYSTGPHLHFVVRKNIGLKTLSIPFKFVDQNGLPFEPRKGMMIAVGNSS